jgi:hypothetical protein
MFVIQSRWKEKGDKFFYYGLRNKCQMFKNEIKVNKKQLEIIHGLPKELNEQEIKAISKLIKFGVVVKEEQYHKIPTSITEARFCKECAMNDYMVPGVEFDDNGLCPICQTKEVLEQLKGVNPVVNIFPRSKKSRFDVAVFYTGGKDSTYLLYYLSKVLNLRVLSLTWEIPYMSDCARQSIENAKKKLPNVEFITRYVSADVLKKIYNKTYELNENTCMCPSLAYILFYPELVANKVPYFVVGNEPSQVAGLYYNHMAPLMAYKFAKNKFLNFMLNVGRVITLHPPFRSGQFHTLATMKQLAYGDSKFKTIAGYNNELVTNVCKAIKEIPLLTKPLKRAIRSSSWSGNIPRFVQVDFDEIAGGEYNWKNVKDVITKECGWVSPDYSNKGLHTSCKIEKCKEYSQFNRFYHMRSRMIPFSAIEMAIASRSKCLTKEEAMDEINNCLGFSLEGVPECAIMKEFINR